MAWLIFVEDTISNKPWESIINTTTYRIWKKLGLLWGSKLKKKANKCTSSSFRFSLRHLTIKGLLHISKPCVQPFEEDFHSNAASFKPCVQSAFSSFFESLFTSIRVRYFKKKFNKNDFPSLNAPNIDKMHIYQF